MIVASNVAGSTRSVLQAGGRTADADTGPPAGRDDGFRPHQLLEAALASCVAITLRMVADERGIPLEAADVTVELDRSNPEEAVFRSRIELRGELTDDQRSLLLGVARRCPVRKTLARKLIFDDPA